MTKVKVGEKEFEVLPAEAALVEVLKLLTRAVARLDLGR